MSANIVIRVNGSVVLAIGAALLVPTVISWLYATVPGKALVARSGDDLARRDRCSGHLLPSSRAVGYVSNRDVYLSVTLAWVLAALLGGVSFSLVGTFGGLLDSTFETMSGFTTTGATLLSDMEAETPSILS